MEKRINFSKSIKIINYLVIGLLTTLINFFTYSFFIKLGIYYIASNLIAFMVSIFFSYLTNKKWVFLSHGKDLEELVKFVASRILTLGMEMAILYLLITFFKLNPYWVKIFTNCCVITANYMMGEFVVFNKKKVGQRG